MSAPRLYRVMVRYDAKRRIGRNGAASPLGLVNDYVVTTVVSVFAKSRKVARRALIARDGTGSKCSVSLVRTRMKRRGRKWSPSRPIETRATRWANVPLPDCW